MAATYELDVSMALDDLGWHFANWHHKGLARETLLGLLELGASEEAEIFSQALKIAFVNWDLFANEDFVQAYAHSEIEEALDPLNDRLWVLLGYRGKEGKALVHRWVPYARQYPERVCATRIA